MHVRVHVNKLSWANICVWASLGATLGNDVGRGSRLHGPCCDLLSIGKPLTTVHLFDEVSKGAGGWVGGSGGRGNECVASRTKRRGTGSGNLF